MLARHARHASEQGREDLAAQIAFLLLRAAWERTEPIDAAELVVARRLFEDQADHVWQQVKDANPVDLTTRSRTGLDGFVLHPVKAARLCECLALLALLSLDGPAAGRADAIGDYLARFVAASPAAAHPVSDEAASSVLATTTALAATGRADAAGPFLKACAVWVLDAIEHCAGLAAVGEPAEAAVRRLLGAAYPSLWPPAPETSSYTLAVLLDLAHLLGFRELYEDLLNDLDAVGAIAQMVAPDEDGGQRLSPGSPTPRTRGGLPRTITRSQRTEPQPAARSNGSTAPPAGQRSATDTCPPSSSRLGEAVDPLRCLTAGRDLRGPHPS